MGPTDVHLGDWVIHRPNVVRSVAARVPGVDAEEAASRALEKMIRLFSAGGTIDDPAPYWRRAAVNEAISMTREARRAHPVEDGTLAQMAPAVGGAELSAERAEDVKMLRSALAALADDDRRLLFDRHVHDRAVSAIADDLGVRPHAVTMRLRRAEERLAAGFAAAHAREVSEPECRTTRAAMHDYLKGRLLPRRQKRLEAHLDGCADCTRAFIDVREVSWMLRDVGPVIVVAGLATGATAAAATSAAATHGVVAFFRAAWGPTSAGRHAVAAARRVASVAVVGGTVALLLNGPELGVVEHTPPAARGVTPVPAPPPTPVAPLPDAAAPVDQPAAQETTPPPAPLIAGPVEPAALPTLLAPKPSPAPVTPQEYAVPLSASEPSALAVFQIVPSGGATITGVQSSSSEDQVIFDEPNGSWFVIAFPSTRWRPQQENFADTSVVVTLTGPAGSSAELVKSTPGAVGGVGGERNPGDELGRGGGDTPVPDEDPPGHADPPGH